MHNNLLQLEDKLIEIFTIFLRVQANVYPRRYVRKRFYSQDQNFLDRLVTFTATVDQKKFLLVIEVFSTVI